MSEDNSEGISSGDILRMTVDIVTAYIGNNQLPAVQIPDVLRIVHGSLRSAEGSSAGAQDTLRMPAVPVRRSITPEYIVCLEDGKKLKLLKRHLRTNYGITPEEYRARWKLPPNYPMVAPNYARQRSEFARKIGLGRKSNRGPSRKRPTASAG